MRHPAYPNRPIRHCNSALSHENGFTLLELLIVLAIVVLGFAVVGLNISSGNDSIEFKAVARDMVSGLRYARGQALISHRSVTLDIDLENNSYTISGHNKSYRIPHDIDITLVTVQQELNGQGQGSVRFYTDGSSTGGRITLEKGQTLWRIDINPLTGQINLANE